MLHMQQIIDAAIATFGSIPIKTIPAQDSTWDLWHTKQTLYHSATEEFGTYIDHTFVFIPNSMQYAALNKCLFSAALNHCIFSCYKLLHFRNPAADIHHLVCSI